jgi:hypothetical protein
MNERHKTFSSRRRHDTLLNYIIYDVQIPHSGHGQGDGQGNVRYGVVNEFIFAVVGGFGISNDINKVPEEAISATG